eukprot:SAG11_NODE_33010_length_279_cov_1.155556_1_plen_29_part_01
MPILNYESGKINVRQIHDLNHRRGALHDG